MMVDIVADYGAVGNGIANDRPAFLAFKAANQGATVTLTSPAGKTYFIGARSSPADANEDYLFSGVANLIFDANNSTLTDNGTGNDFHLGARQAFFQDKVHSAKIATVAAGATTVTLLTSSDENKFTVGSWICVTGFVLQDGGFPVNFNFFDYVQVTSKQTSVLPYTISFTPALSHDYLSTWPDWGVGGPGEQDINGPACLYVLDQIWNCTHEYRNLTVAKTGATRKPTNAQCRLITLQNVTPTNQDGINPSAQSVYSCSGCNFSAVSMEADKCVDQMNFSGCTMGTVSFQSSSINLLSISNSTLNGFLVGSPKATTITGSTMSSIFPGAAGYGSSQSLTASNSVIADVGLGGWIYKGGNSFIGDDIGVNNGLNTMTNGVIRIPKSYTAKSVSWAIPGQFCAWRDQDRTCIKLFRVVTVTDDATYVYVQTSEFGTWPIYNSSGGGKLYIQTHPAPACTFTNCSATAPAGTADTSIAYMLSQAPAGKPIYSFGKYTCTGTAQTQGGTILWGNLQSMTVAVNSPYAGVNPLQFDPAGWFDWTTNANGSLGSYIPTINARIAGTRTVTLGTGVYDVANAQSLDTALTPPETPTWIANRVFGFWETDISGGGSFASIVVTFQTDQGIPAVVPPSLPDCWLVGETATYNVVGQSVLTPICPP